MRQDTLFYDGHCGLCHNAVKFALEHDRSRSGLRFAPLQGETFQASIPESQRAGLPDTMVLQTSDGTLLIRSDAWIHILRRVGGGWSAIAALLAVIPRPLRDAFYNFVARIRHRVAGRRANICPTMPPHLRARFDP